MALRAELIGPYRLILVMVLFVLIRLASFSDLANLSGADDSARIDCGCPQV